MKDAAELKEIVRDKYGEIARSVKIDKDEKDAGCCGPAACREPAAGVHFADGYEDLDGYDPGADLGLGCGLPVPLAGIRKGDTVLDLGSGAGNDVFVARAEVGPSGRVIGVDMVEDMVALARENAARLGAENVTFHVGEIEDLPLPAADVDVVVSNCVLNLVPDKEAAFREIHRVLRPGGHFCISDIVLVGDLPAGLEEAAALYSGCVSGAMQKDDYLDVIAGAGFRNVQVKAFKEIDLPGDFVRKTAGEDGLAEWRRGAARILSLTITGVKPA